MAGKIGVALIGSGIFIKEEHLPAVQACPDLELKAIYSRSLKSAKSISETLSGVELYSDDSSASYKDLISRSDVHAVLIALPIMVQPQFIREALEAGKHVLAEKPIANDVKAAKELVDWYHAHVDTAKVNFSIAEQFRYMGPWLRAAEWVRHLGPVVGARVRMHTLIEGGKYFETEWRKTPSHQGGFLLDGGVHFIAGLRLMLSGSGAKVRRLSAYTKLLQPYLPPVDTVDAALEFDNGATGTFSVSFGTTLSGSEWTVACEGGSVSVSGDELTTKHKGRLPRVQNVKAEARQSGAQAGVEDEVFAWAKSIKDGKWDPSQSAEEGLADLEILEALLRSGEQGGKPMELNCQVDGGAAGLKSKEELEHLGEYARD